MADKLLPKKHGSQATDEVGVGIRLQNIPRASSIECTLDDVDAPMLTQKNDLGPRRGATNYARRFKSIHTRETAVHQNQVRLQVFSLAHRLEAIDGGGNDFQVGFWFKYLENESMPGKVVVNQKNMRYGHPRLY